MKQPPSDYEQLAQAIADLETLVREELIAMQYEIIGIRDALSEELDTYFEELHQRLSALL